MSEITELAKGFYVNEINDYRLYSELAKRAKKEELRRSLEHIANMEKGHARFWREFLKRRGEDIPSERKELFQTFVLLLGRVVNPMLLVSLLELGEANAYTQYYRFLKDKGSELSQEEIERLKSIILDELSHESTFRERVEELGLSNVRDMVLGMNDGLVELLGVVAGLSAVYRHEPAVVGASAVVVGVAGAISMGVGAFISVRSQRQVNEALREREMIISEVSGEATSQAPDEPTENELKSALFTGLSYLLGVVFPVSPYFFMEDSLKALSLSLGLAFMVLSFVASFIAVASGISLRKKVLEMVLSAGFAAGASFLIGGLVKSLFNLQLP
ncbi:VIT1/CCC1 transporter family protein [Hydrogenivirga sp.]